MQQRLLRVAREAMEDGPTREPTLLLSIQTEFGPEIVGFMRVLRASRACRIVSSSATW